MLTPKGKALELRNKHRLFSGTSKDDDGDNVNNYRISKGIAKMSAIISIDELIDSYSQYTEMLDQDFFSSEREFWICVKQELIKLK